MTHLAKGVCSKEHIVSRTPSNVTVQRDLERLRNLALDLQPFEVLNTLS